MRLHNFFIEEKIGERKEIAVSSTELIHQWRKVFRFKTGNVLTLMDNSGFEFDGQIVSLGDKEARILIRERRKNIFAPKKELLLFFALIRRDRVEWILEKATELGVSHFHPVASERGIDDRKLNEERSQKIIKEAAEQSGRGVLPTLHEPVSLIEAVVQNDFPKIAFDPSGNQFDNSSLATLNNSLCVFIGPEGGWSSGELSLFKSKNIPIFSLGTQILRAETAAVAVSALLLLG